MLNDQQYYLFGQIQTRSKWCCIFTASLNIYFPFKVIFETEILIQNRKNISNFKECFLKKINVKNVDPV